MISEIVQLVLITKTNRVCSLGQLWTLHNNSNISCRIGVFVCFSCLMFVALKCSHLCGSAEPGPGCGLLQSWAWTLQSLACSPLHQEFQRKVSQRMAWKRILQVGIQQTDMKVCYSSAAWNHWTICWHCDLEKKAVKTSSNSWVAALHQHIVPSMNLLRK